jgi:acyl-CoA synthetase (AMP-forming)/AMP-acid ligase II
LITVVDALQRNRRRHPDGIAVIDQHTTMTYGQLADRAWALARGLRGLGIEPGETVAVLTGNSAFAAETYLGIVAAGAVAAPCNWRWATPELVHGLDESRARVLLVERPFQDAADAALASGDLERINQVVTEGDAYEALLRPGGDPGVRPGGDDPNVVLFTGGTTGFSKGVLLSHRNVMANAVNEIVDTDMHAQDVTLLITPMFHSASLLCWFVPHLVLGATSVLIRQFDEDEAAATMARHRVTNCFLVPSMVRRMLGSGELTKHDLGAFERLYVGGSSFRLPDKEGVRDALPSASIYYQYGLTEAGPIVTRLRPEDMFDRELDGSIGFEFLLTEVRIEQPDGAPADDGEVGELAVHGPNVMLGYLGRPEATAEVLHDGWLRTGDLARRGPRGELWFHDRRKDMIKSGGENVYSAEVEQVLYAHPSVQEAAVLGVPSPDWDEEVRAVVALRPGAPEVSGAELQAHCRAHLAGYKVPKRIAVVAPSAIPVNASGKVVKAELRERFAWRDEEPSSEGAAPRG